MARSIRSGGATKARVSPAVARQIDSQVDRLLTLLRERIRATRHTQEQIQTKLGWGRSYISQILTRQKTVRFDQLFAILQVIGVEPEDFFADLGWKGAKSVGFKPASIADVGQGHDELAKLLLLFETLSVTLIRNGSVSAMEWLKAVYVVRHHASADRRPQWNRLVLLACAAEIWGRIEQNRLRSPVAIRPLLADIRDRLLTRGLDVQLLAGRHGFEHAQAEIYVKQRRLELASLLLAGCHLSISDMARILDLGKADSFSDAFLRWSGMRPSAYRKKHMPPWLRPPGR